MPSITTCGKLPVVSCLYVQNAHVTFLDLIPGLLFLLPHLSNWCLFCLSVMCWTPQEERYSFSQLSPSVTSPTPCHLLSNCLMAAGHTFRDQKRWGSHIAGTSSWPCKYGNSHTGPAVVFVLCAKLPTLSMRFYYNSQYWDFSEDRDRRVFFPLWKLF